MSNLATTTIGEGYEPIPGYRLLDRLGSGGFGEVWRCDAPGGLHKAIKFVFGALTDKRAKRELKSLERIKGVHHPFLLTLERFEVVDGRLIIITELADGSLEDVYRRHCDRGSSGIPRKSLLSYLQDSADALDYLNDSFQLQHLDVKPGNLLMVGGHVKVADFGLLKDLRDVDCSVVGGLTPVYAAPEVFDGRPCATSDQYSMAVMYQELLTGTRPFSGRTIAQLATQHVHSAPNLESLPAPDRPVVAKALEKTPSRRFASCLEFVEALRVASDQSARSRRGTSVGEMYAETQTGTYLGGSAMVASPVEDLPEITANVDAIKSHGTTEHALVIGIGGSGAECLHRMRSRIANLYPSHPLDLHSILIDTDAETVEGARLAETSGRVTPCTAIYTPLKTPKQYRESGTTHLVTVSRRWLYNVPRSGMTEGLRPLGRLAMVDHGVKIRTQAIEAINHLAAVCGNSIPRIYVVASLAGGTGSGMVWDVIYLIRHLLDENGLAAAEMRPLLTIPDLTSVSRTPLPTATAHAAINELSHYLKPGNSYPGDEGAGWPGVPSARSPLSNAYVVSVAESEINRHSGIEMISEYIWADATKGGKVLEAARREPNVETVGVSKHNPTIRSLGAARLQSCRKVELPRLARTISVSLLKNWLGRPVEAKQLAATSVEKLARRVLMDSISLEQSAWSPLSQDDTQRWKQIHDVFNQIPTESYNFEEIQKAFNSGGLMLRPETEDVARKFAAGLVKALRHEMSLRLQDGRCDVTTACETLILLKESLASCNELHQLSGPRRLVEAEDAETAMKGGLSVWQPNEVLGNAREPGPMMRWADLKMRAAVDERLTRRLQFVLEGVDCLTRELNHCVTNLAIAIKHIGSSVAANGVVDDPWKSLPPEARSERGKAEEATRQIVALTALAFTQVGYQESVKGQALAASVVDVALPIVESLMSGEMIDSGPAGAGMPIASAATSGTQASRFESIGDALKAIRPLLLVCGGRQRLVLLVGTEAERLTLRDEVANAHGHAISVLVVPGISPTLIHEAQGILVGEVLSRLQISLGGETRIAGRLSTRCDVNWNAE